MALITSNPDDGDIGRSLAKALGFQDFEAPLPKIKDKIPQVQDVIACFDLEKNFRKH